MFNQISNALVTSIIGWQYIFWPTWTWNREWICMPPDNKACSAAIAVVITDKPWETANKAATCVKNVFSEPGGPTKQAFFTLWPDFYNIILLIIMFRAKLCSS